MNEELEKALQTIESWTDSGVIRNQCARIRDLFAQLEEQREPPAPSKSTMDIVEAALTDCRQYSTARSGGDFLREGVAQRQIRTLASKLETERDARVPREKVREALEKAWNCGFTSQRPESRYRPRDVKRLLAELDGGQSDGNKAAD